ncbi:MAG TPA: PAS domain S-box protein [Steroidobacteraceae bacterium]|nr:PAS domain S-box protein [Steroidobacteraceae bacterium]
MPEAVLQNHTSSYPRSLLIAAFALLTAIGLRWVLDPALGNTLPLVTGFGAVACAVWAGGVWPAAVVAILGYVACAWLFIEPRGSMLVLTSANVFGFIAYAFTCGVIIVMGHALRHARRQVLRDQAVRRRYAEEQAQQLLSARFLASIVESSEDAIISKSLDGIIKSWNVAAERLFGHTPEQVIGKHISVVIPPDRLAEEDRIIASLSAGRRIEHFETERLHRDGYKFPVALTISPIYNDAGQVVGASKIVRDISARRQAEAERARLADNLRQLAAELSSADTRKNEFLATLAHELRNPLAPMSSLLEVLRLDDSDPALRRRARDTMDRQLRQLVRLVDDLLDLSRITHNRLELRKSDVALGAILQTAVEICRPLTEAAQQELRLDIEGGAIYLHADPTRLAQVFGNLLTNASRYSPTGATITVTVRRRGEQVEVRVRDTGIGIPLDRLQDVFEMFTQVADNARAQGGLGIGLTLARRLVGLHGGTIEAHSAGVGKGSEFAVLLPILSMMPALDATAPESRPAAPRRVLVVDDNEDAAESLAMLLGLNGNETHLAHDGEAALAAAEKYRPDLILLDIGMPRMNGHEVCRRLRLEPWGRDLKVIAVTGWGQEQDRHKTEEAGFDGHLVKPVDPATLNDVLAAV